MRNFQLLTVHPCRYLKTLTKLFVLGKHTVGLDENDVNPSCHAFSSSTWIHFGFFGIGGEGGLR